MLRSQQPDATKSTTGCYEVNVVVYLFILLNHVFVAELSGDQTFTEGRTSIRVLPSEFDVAELNGDQTFTERHGFLQFTRDR